MATYNIDKITLPNGDVCNLDSASISENLLVNGGPEVVNGIAATYSPYSWQYYTNSPQVVDSMAVEKDCITFNVVLASGAYFQLQKIGSYDRTSGISGVFGGLMLYDLNDGDKITLSFEYKCGFGIGYIPRLWAQEDSTSTDLQVFLTASDTPIELSSANDWTKVTYTGTIPEGWTHAMSVLYSIGHLYRLHLVFNFIPHNTGNFYIRHIKLNRGEIATEYNANPLSRLHQIGAGGSYIGARNGALIKNMGNQFAAGSSGFFPVSGVKSDTGFWASGCTGDKYQFSYLTDANYVANNNYAEIYSLPAPDASISEFTYYNIITTKNISDIPDASTTQAGKVNTDTTTAQLFRGIKTFDSDTITIANGSSRDTHNYAQIQFNDKTFSSDPDTGNGTRAGYIVCGRSNVGSSLGNLMQFLVRSPKSDGTGYTSYYDGFKLPQPGAGNTANSWYDILTTKNPHDIPIETITATAGTNVSIVSQSVKRTGNVVAGYIRFTTSASIAPYAYVINSLPAAAHGAVFTLFDQYNGQINNSNVCLYMDVSNAGLRVSAGNLAAGTYSIYFNYICS